MTPGLPTLDAKDFAAAGGLPASYEYELRRVLAAQPDGGGTLIERLLGAKEAVEITLPDNGATLLLAFDPNSASLIVCDPTGAEGRVWQWRRLRRLVLRDRLLRGLSRHNGAVHELSPIVRETLRYPRPVVSSAANIKALFHLAEQADARLEISENVTFDRKTFPFIDEADDNTAASLRHQVQAQLSNLSSDQSVAMVQDGAFENAVQQLVPVVFSIDSFSELSTVVREANPPSRITVSLALPCEAEFHVDLGPGHKDETARTEVTLLYLDLTPGDVMEVMRENTLIMPAETVLEQNGLSLLSLSIRESRLD